MTAPVQKSKLLFLNSDGQLSPWSELGIQAPSDFEVEGWPLVKLNEWQASQSQRKFRLVLVDLDVISRTKGLDDWALQAWRNSFNELITKLYSKDGQSPTMLCFTRDPSWEQALLAIKLGARDLCKLSMLNERIQHYSSQPSSAADFVPHVENKPQFTENVVPFRSSQATQAQAMEMTLKKKNNESYSIPRHAIPFPIDGLDGGSPAIEQVRSLIRKSAPLDTSILITGPTGTGKELVAKALHRYSARKEGPFIVINCAAISKDLLEAELFGYVKGAFTGANENKIGLLQAANGGSLFLDEVSELSFEFQSKLLRAIQDKMILPVGATQSVQVDFRLICATQKELVDEVRASRFREDLLFRIKVIEIPLPSLHERRQDLPEISTSVLKRLSKKNKKPFVNISDAAMEKCLLYRWPGNVRELENAIEHAATLAWSEARSEITITDLPLNLQNVEMDVSAGSEYDLRAAVSKFEKEYIQGTIQRLGGSKEHAAEVLGLSLATLYRKIAS